MTITYFGSSFKHIFVAVLLASIVIVMLIAFMGSFRNTVTVPVRKTAVMNGTKMDKKSLNHKFDMRGNDVMVFLHIQKTGGSMFGSHLINNLDIERPCVCSKNRSRQPLLRKRVYHCFRPGSSRIWLFSRLHLGWPCGLHADWTEHRECVPKYMNKREGRNKRRKFVYITILREPISRFLSEFFFVLKKGEMWRTASLRCNGRSPTKGELPSCFEKKDLRNLTIEEFLACPWNLAFNRQTRMLADLRRVNCYNTTGMSTEQRGKLLLESAIRNVREMAFFGLTEYQEENQYLFEKTLGLKFLVPLMQLAVSDTTAGSVLPKLNSTMLAQIKTLNSLDVQLYAFAKNLFFKRLKLFKKADIISMETKTDE